MYSISSTPASTALATPSIEEKDVKKTVAGKEVIEKKKWRFFQLSQYRWLNFVEVRDRAIDMGKGLVELGLDKGQIFNIYAATA